MSVSLTEQPKRKFPSWIRMKVGCSHKRNSVESILKKFSLNTVCQSAKCPNLGECWERQTATFMILGKKCTRNCRFCAVEHSSNPLPPDPNEPVNLAKAAAEMMLSHVVITSVTRDDLDDGGASHFAAAIRELSKILPNASIEVLTPDFGGNFDSLKKVIHEKPAIFNHNVETVERLTCEIRSGAVYDRSLKLLESACKISSGVVTVKSGLMAGLGETDSEIEKTISDIRNTGAKMLTIGQYLAPTINSWPVKRFAEPEKFAEWKRFAESIGFKNVMSGPMVRSSYHAEMFFEPDNNER